MAEKSGSDQPPPYSGQPVGFSNQSGAHFAGGNPKSDAYPQLGGAYILQGGAYPPQGGAYPPQGGAYPLQGGAYPPAGEAYAAQPGYAQGYSQSTTAVIVSQPGAAGHVVVQPRPPDYMIASVLTCLFCFWPTGLCAIYYAMQANKLVAEGDMVSATNMSNNARNLAVSSIIIGIIWITLVIVLQVAVYSRTYYGYN